MTTKANLDYKVEYMWGKLSPSTQHEGVQCTHVMKEKLPEPLFSSYRQPSILLDYARNISTRNDQTLSIEASLPPKGGSDFKQATPTDTKIPLF